jgi:hypothetical protein
MLVFVMRGNAESAAAGSLTKRWEGESGTELSPDREDVPLRNQEVQRQLVKQERNEKFLRPGREQKCFSR